jgi:peptidoglycan L-alanyl-D-glutamate endopeptidase CwlK
MPLGRTSKLRLATCDARLQRLVTAVVARVDAGELALVPDISVGCGYRNEADQNAAFDRGASKLRWPKSKHNKTPSQAVDLWLCPLDWSKAATPAWEALRALVLDEAAKQAIPIRTISWDLPHFELA